MQLYFIINDILLSICFKNSDPISFEMISEKLNTHIIIIINNNF